MFEFFRAPVRAPVRARVRNHVSIDEHELVGEVGGTARGQLMGWGRRYTECPCPKATGARTFPSIPLYHLGLLYDIPPLLTNTPSSPPHFSVPHVILRAESYRRESYPVPPSHRTIASSAHVTPRSDRRSRWSDCVRCGCDDGNAWDRDFQMPLKIQITLQSDVPWQGRCSRHGPPARSFPSWRTRPRCGPAQSETEKSAESGEFGAVSAVFEEAFPGVGGTSGAMRTYGAQHCDEKYV